MVCASHLAAEEAAHADFDANRPDRAEIGEVFGGWGRRVGIERRSNGTEGSGNVQKAIEGPGGGNLDEETGDACGRRPLMHEANDVPDESMYEDPDVAAAARRRANKIRNTTQAREQGAMTVCLAHALSGLVVCGWPSGLVRVMDCASGRCVHQSEGGRALQDATMTSLCLIPRPLHGAGESCQGSGREDKDAISWAVVRGRSDGVLQVLPAIQLQGSCGDADEDVGEEHRAGIGCEHGLRGNTMSEIGRMIELGKSPVAVIRWLNHLQVKNVFSRPIHANIRDKVSHFGAIFAACGDGTLWFLNSKLTLAPLYKLATNSIAALVSASLSPSQGGSIVCGFANGSVEVWSIFDQETERFHKAFSSWVTIVRNKSKKTPIISEATSSQQLGLQDTSSRNLAQDQGSGTVGGEGSILLGVPKHPRLHLIHHLDPVQVFCSPNGDSMVKYHEMHRCRMLQCIALLLQHIRSWYR